MQLVWRPIAPLDPRARIVDRRDCGRLPRMCKLVDVGTRQQGHVTRSE